MGNLVWNDHNYNVKAIKKPPCGDFLVSRIRFVSLRSATTELSDYAQKIENQQGKKENTQMLTWKTQQSWEKPRQPTSCRIHYEKGIQRRGYTEATSSLSLSVSLSLSLSLYTRVIQLQMFNNNFTFALSHIYTYMTFGLFTHMAPRGPQSVGKITIGP